MKWLIMLIAIIIIGFLISVIYIEIVHLKIRYMNKASEIIKGMSAVKALKILGPFYDKKENTEEEIYYWNLKKKNYNGIKKIKLTIKKKRVYSIEYE